MHHEQLKPWSAELVDSIFSGKISPVVSDQFDALLRWLGGRTTPDALAIDSELKRRDVDIEEAASLALVLLEKLLFENRDDPFSVLGLTRSATEGKIDKRYKRLISIFHPDRQYADAEWLHRCTERLNTAYDRIRRGETDSASLSSSPQQSRGVRSRHTAKSGTSGSTSGYTYGESESDVERLVRSTLGSARSFQIKVFSGLLSISALVVGYLYLLDSTNQAPVFLPESPSTAIIKSGGSIGSESKSASQLSSRDVDTVVEDFSVFEAPTVSTDAATSPEALESSVTQAERDARIGMAETASDFTMMQPDAEGTLAVDKTSKALDGRQDPRMAESESNDSTVVQRTESRTDTQVEYAEIENKVEIAFALPVQEPRLTEESEAPQTAATWDSEGVKTSLVEEVVEPEETEKVGTKEVPAPAAPKKQTVQQSSVHVQKKSDSSAGEVQSASAAAQMTSSQRKLKESDVINMVNRTLSRLGAGMERADPAVLEAVFVPVVKVDEKTVQRRALIDEQKALRKQMVWRRVNHKVVVTTGSTSPNPRARGITEEKRRYKDGRVEEMARQFEFGFDIDGDKAVISSMTFWNEQRVLTALPSRKPVETAGLDKATTAINSAAAEDFLARYVNTYEAGDINTFARYFSPDARHQRLQGRDAIYDYYRKFFDSTAWREIELKNLVMQPSRDVVERVLADFVVTGEESNNKSVYLAGRLELDLRGSGDGIMIERLTWREATHSARPVVDPPLEIASALGEGNSVPNVKPGPASTEAGLPTAGIEKFLAEYQAAYNAEDLASFGQKFAVNARQKRLKGREEVTRFYRDFFNTTRWHKLEFGTPRIAAKAERVYAVKVSFSVTGEDNSGAPINLSGQLGLDLIRSSKGFEIAQLDY